MLTVIKPQHMLQWMCAWWEQRERKASLGIRYYNCEAIITNRNFGNSDKKKR